ncbi:dermonecrotic toxin domain-containing protein [Pseudomonas typographi]|uniref:Dermonecrotic toxin N-terminal domain-containing protein n=1 Tax=Pseudomonas typographi TaxID=2715964 RepID=A0ABR7Z749_9PSED|nr:DUF6543 domain-containing protein [Pseudomonas typographi]MBD1601272.1 hypothetical protein [Pseudomonas typographi]
MKTTLSVFNEVALHASLVGDVARRLVKRPSLYHLANQLIAQAYAVDYPGTSVQPKYLTLVTPIYQDEDHQVFQGYDCSGLAWVLIDRHIHDQTLNFVEGYQFITDQPEAERPRKLPIRMDDVTRWVDELSRGLTRRYCESLVSFWNAHDHTGISLWEWVGRALRESARHETDLARREGRLSVPEAAVLTAAAAPSADAAALAATDGFLAIGTGTAMLPLPAMMEPCLALAAPGAMNGQGPWVTYSPIAGLKRFETSQQLASHIADQLDAEVFTQAPELTIEAPLGNAFDAMARRLLEQQLDHLAQVRRLTQGTSVEAPSLDLIYDLITCMLEVDRVREKRDAKRIKEQLPAWLANASDADKRRYAEGLGRLAVSPAAFSTSVLFNGIGTIEAFTAERLSEQMRADQPDQVLPAVEDIEIVLSRVPNALLGIVNAGDFTVQEQRISVVELAIDNLAGRPPGQLSVAAAHGTVLPAWCNAAYVQRLVTAVDIGRNYLALLQSQLTGQGPGVAARRSAFIHQLQIQLPLIALELKLKGQNGLTNDTVRLVRHAVADVAACDMPAALFRLAWQAGPQLPLDVVRAVYVIAPRDGRDGPRVLYTPLDRTVLRGFASQQALDQALREEGDLQGFMLAWLPDAVRARYSGGGLDQPHIIRFGQGNEFAPLNVPGPATLREQPITQQWGEAVYDECVAALITVADRRSVSNAENRWVSYKALGWVVFNGLLPVLSGPVATAGWMLQAFEALNEVFEAQAGQQPQQAEAAFNELLFNLAFYLFAEALKLPGAWALPPARAATEAAAESVLPGALRPRLGTTDHGAEQTVPRVLDSGPLELNWASPRGQLAPKVYNALLALRVDAPNNVGSPVPFGPARGLVLAGDRFLAALPQGWFEVALVADSEDMFIVDPAAPERRGPPIRRDEAGRFQLDLGLRLRGGQVRRPASDPRVNEVNRQFNDWLKRSNAQSQKMLFTFNLIETTLKSDRPHRYEEAIRLRDNYQATATGLVTEAVEIRQALEQVNRHAAVPNYASRVAAARHIEASLLVDLARNRQLQIIEQTFRRRRGLAEGAREQINDDSYLEYLRTVSQWMSELVELNHRMDETIEALGEIPGEGVKHRRTLLPQFAEIPSALDWRISRLRAWGTLALREVTDALPEAGVDLAGYLPQAQRALGSFDLALDGIAARSVGSVQPAPATWSQSAATLDTVALELTAVRDGLAFMCEGQPSLAGNTYLSKIIQEAEALRTEVERELEDVLQEDVRERRRLRKAKQKSKRRQYRAGHRAQPSDRPGPSSSLAVRPNEPEQGAAAKPTDAVTILKSLELIEPMRALEIDSGQRTLNELARQAEQRLAEVPALTAKARRWLSGERIAIEMEELLTGPAQTLERLAARIDQWVARQNQTDLTTEAGSAERLGVRLNGAAAQLRAEGQRLRIETYLRGKPTAQALEYLHGKGKVKILPLSHAKTLKRKEEGNVLREAQINDEHDQPLWYAHFHYNQVGNLLAAHLKTPAQRFEGVAAHLQQQQRGEHVTAIYRGKLPEAVVRALFPDAMTAQR